MSDQEQSQWPPASCPIEQKVNCLLDAPFLMGSLLVGVAIGGVLSIAGGYYSTYLLITLLSNQV